MVRAVATHLETCGFTDVRADLADFTDKPEIIFGTMADLKDRPDATAHTKDGLILAEVETEDTIADPHTQVQWPLFAQYAQEQGGAFWVVVPPGEVLAAEARLGQLGIAAEIKVVRT
jgi:hypothetical protein